MRALAITGMEQTAWMLDHLRVGHAADAALADIGGHALERHDGHGAASSATGPGLTTSMMTPPLSISASPRLTRGSG